MLFDKFSSLVDTLFVPFAEAWDLSCKIFLICLPFIIGFYCIKFLVHVSRYYENQDE